MKIKILLALIGLLLVARFISPSSEKIDYDKQFTIPNFSLKILDGEEGLFNSSDLNNGVSLLTFMSYTCGYCTKQSKYMSKNGFMIPVYVISINDSKEGVVNWANRNDIKPYYERFGVMGQAVGREFGVSRVPTSFIVINGVVVKRIPGMIDASRIPEIKRTLTELGVEIK